MFSTVRFAVVVVLLSSHVAAHQLASVEANGFPTATGSQPPPTPDDPKKQQERVQELMGRLRDNHPEVRHFAARQLGELGAAAAPALPLLVKALDDGNGQVRIEAAAALCQLGHAADRAVSVLLATLKDKQFRESAAHTLRHTPGPKAGAGVPPLQQALADQDASVRTAAAWALAHIGPVAKAALPTLRKILDDPNQQVRVGAAFAVCRVGDDLKAGLPVLIAALKERDHATLGDATDALHALGASARPAVPALVALLRERTEPGYTAACYALQGIGPAAKDALPALLAALSAKQPAQVKSTRQFFGHPSSALAGIGRDAIAPLILLLKHDEHEVRGRARWGLVRIGKDAVPALVAAWKGDDPLLRENAWWALADLGDPGVPIFLKALDDPKYRLEAAHGLMHMKRVPASALPPLLQLLDDPDPAMRARVARAVGMVENLHHLQVRVSPESAARRRAALALEPLLSDKSAKVRDEAMIGLRCLGQEAVPVWGRAMKHKDVAVRRLATQGFSPIDALGLRGSEIVPALLGAADDEDKTVRINASLALGSPSPEMIQELLKVLVDRKAAQRVRAAEFLGATGADAKGIVPRLLPLLNDPDPKVRAAIGQALQKIDPRAKEEARRIRECVDALASKDPAFRSSAIRRLGEAGEAAAPALPLLVKALDDADGHVRVEAAAALCRLGHQADRAAALLLAAVKDKDLRLQAVHALRYSPGPRATAAVPVLLKALPDQDANVRIAAAWALAGIGPGARATLPVLRKALDDPIQQVRVGVAFALSRTGDLKTGLPVLIAALKAGDPWVLEDAGIALAQLGADAAPAVPALAALVRAHTEPAFGVACYALHGIGPAAKDAIPHLIAALRAPPPTPPALPRQPLGNPSHALVGIGKAAVAPLGALLNDADSGGAAGWALARIGKDAVPTLTAAWKSDDKQARFNAWQALADMGAAGAPVFLEALNDPVRRLEAARGLWHVHVVPASALPPLLQLLHDPDPEMRTQVALAVGRVEHLHSQLWRHTRDDAAPDGVARRRAALALEPLLNDKHAKVREAAMVGLRDLGPEAAAAWGRAMKHQNVAVRRLATEGFNPEAAVGIGGPYIVPALLTAVDDADAQVRQNVLLALTGGGLPRAEMVQGLVEVVVDVKSAQRVRAAEFLGAVGANAREVVPRLLPLLDDPDARVRAAVGQALKKIDPEGTAKRAHR